MPTQREIVSKSPRASWNRLTQGLIDVGFQCRVLRISSLELLHHVRLIKIEIHNIDDRCDGHLSLSLGQENNKLTL